MQITSQPLVFLDTTDSRKLEVYISSNHPTVQLYNVNDVNSPHTPDWNKTNLKLKADVFLDSDEITPQKKKWYRQTINDTEEALISTGDYTDEITVSANMTSAIVTYICRVEYQGLTAFSKITFTKTDTGRNGTDGKDGTSVRILGTATAKESTTKPGYYEITYNEGAVTAAALGDAYIHQSTDSTDDLNGHLFVCAILNDNVTSNDYFLDAGNIQGPAGKDGEDAKSITLTSNAQVFKVDKENSVSPSQIVVTAHTVNIPQIEWSYNNGNGWTNKLDGISVTDSTFTVPKSAMANDSFVVKASYDTYSDVFTIYKVYDGIKGDPASMAFLTNENISFAANANGQINTLPITCNVVAYKGPEKVMPVVNSSQINDIPSGMHLTVDSTVLADSSKEAMITISVDANATFGSELSNHGTITIPITSPVDTTLKLSWSKINAGPKGEQGDQGVGIENVNVQYGTNGSNTEKPVNWYNEINDIPGGVPDGNYLWTKTIIDYTDPDKDDTVTYTYSRQGVSGSSVEVVDIQYKAHDSATSPPTSGWSSAVVATSETSPYLWTKTTFSDNKSAYSVARYGTDGTKGDKGDDGVGIASTTVTYGVSDSSSTQPTSWQNTIPTVADGKYLWTRTIIDYTDTTRADTVSYTYAKQGTKGETGSAGSSVTVTSIQYQEGSSSTTAPTGTWSNSVVSVADGKYLWTKIVFSDGKTSYGVAKQGSSGRGVSSISEEYYQSTSATAQSGGSWSTTVPTWADGKYIWTRSVITYTDNTTSTTSPICVTGQKGTTGGTGATGATGTGVSSVDVWYYQSTSSASLTGGSWSTTAPTWADGKYVWTKTITTYTNNTTDETAAVCITGQKGATGVGVKSVTEYYLATASSSGVTTSTSGWTTAIQTITSDKKYLWNYEVITYTDNTTSSTAPIIIGAFGNTGGAGATGKGIKSVTEYYLASTSASGVTTSTTGWTTTMQTLTATNKYLWNYELITYTDNSTATINPVIVGVYGDKGDKGNQGDRGAGISSVTVTYGTSTSASTQPTSWQTTLPTVAEGSYLWTRTVTDYTDASIADTVTLTYAKQGAKGSTGSAGTSVTVSSIQYQSGTSATTAPTGTWSNSVVSVAEGSYLWTKTTFSDGKVAYGVAKQGAKGSAGVNAVTFQIYAPNGYLLSNELESLKLQAFAYDGSASITSATYAWSYQENDAWVAVSNATTDSLTITKDDVIKSKTYRCAMTYKNTTYYATATVQDKTDIYDVMICVSDNINPLTGIYYWVVYALLYSEQGEADALLGPISIDAPESPVSGDYWYAVNAATQTVTLKQYNGSSWTTSTEKQAYAYDWRQIVDGTQQQAIGNTDKVQIISCNSFTSSATFQCIVTDTDGSKLARCNIHLTDTSDPIVSATAPTGVKDGQLWMQTQTDGTFLLYIWDADTSTWKQLNADTKNVVHTTKPSSYKAGDLWVVESDTAISGYTKGTLLQSNATSTTFATAHWTPSLKYEAELSEVQNALKTYKQYMSVDSDGLHMQAKNSDGTLSPFQALFTNTRLSFLQDDLEVAYISDNKLNIYEASIDVLAVEKKIQLQKFEWAIESNGSMSLIVNY